MRKFKGMLPAPVYEATFADGTTGRISFWSERGKPLDYAAGRRTAAACYARPRDENGFFRADGKGPVKIGPTAPRFLDFLCVDCKPFRHHFCLEASSEDAVEEIMKHATCPKCGSECVFFENERYHRGSTKQIVYPPKEIVDGYVEVDGERHRDPLFDPEAKPAPKPKGGKLTGIALIESTIAKLDKDQTPEGKWAASVLRNAFGLAEAA